MYTHTYKHPRLMTVICFGNSRHHTARLPGHSYVHIYTSTLVYLYPRHNMSAVPSSTYIYIHACTHIHICIQWMHNNKIPDITCQQYQAVHTYIYTHTYTYMYPTCIYMYTHTYIHTYSGCTTTKSQTSHVNNTKQRISSAML